MTEINGLLVLDKPSGLTSRAALDRATRWFPRRTRLGHTGTLDPLASGVLVLCVGNATRLAEYVQDMKKIYQAGILLGASSDTDDADGNIVAREVGAVPNQNGVEETLRSFIGNIEQVPPNFSAMKVTGRRAYDLARKGETVSLSARQVHIDAIDILSYSYPHLEVEIRCGKGTYVRSIARDLGERLSCGGLVESLRRTRVGQFDVSQSVSLDADKEAAHNAILPLEAAVAELPRLTLDRRGGISFRHGKTILASSELQGTIAAFDEDNHFLGVGEANGGQLQPVKVLRKDEANGGEL